MLWNLIGLSMGYGMLVIKDVLLTVTRPTHMYSAKGFYNLGRRMFYVGWKPTNAILYSLSLLVKLRQPHHFMKGYLSAFKEKSWRCKDPVVEEYYSFTRMLRRNLRISHRKDFAKIVNLGMNPEFNNQLTPQFVEQAIEKIQATLI